MWCRIVGGPTDLWKERPMRIRIVSIFWLLAGLLGVGLTTGDANAAARRWAVVYLDEPMLIGSTIVQGPVVFIHDDVEMAHGEPCTTVRLFDPGKGPIEEIASFHCLPVPRGAVRKFTLRTRPNSELGFGCVLTEYQFAGESEGHGVPTSSNAH
jgi:hypothetical protein